MKDIAKNIFTRFEHQSDACFVVACDCHDGDHSHEIYVSRDDSLITVTIGTTTTSDLRMSRFKKIWNLLVNGHIEVTSELIMTDEVAKNYAMALLDSVDRLNK